MRKTAKTVGLKRKGIAKQAITASGLAKPKVSKVSAIKKRAGLSTKPAADSSGIKKAGPAKKSWTDRLKAGEGRAAARKQRRAERRLKRANRVGARGNVKRAARLEQRAQGTRKSAVGTALSKVGRGIFGSLAALGGSAAGLKRGGTRGSAYKRAAHEKKQK